MMSQLIETRREIYAIVNRDTKGVLLTADQPLDEAAFRVLEVLHDQQRQIAELADAGGIPL